MTCGTVVVSVERSGWMDRYSIGDFVDLGSISIPINGGEHVDNQGGVWCICVDKDKICMMRPVVTGQV